jgi:hypothetical protein
MHYVFISIQYNTVSADHSDRAVKGMKYLRQLEH